MARIKFNRWQRLTPEQRFWPKVRKTESCWIWEGTIKNDGYGTIYVGGRPRMMIAHRLSFMLANGPIPNGLSVLHHCDNPPCVNPAHLFLGTQADNLADMDAKGRRRNYDRRGERNPSGKLTKEQAKYALLSPKSQVVIAKELGVAKSLIWAIRKRHIWSDETLGIAS